MKCYICNCEMEYKDIVIGNPKWGNYKVKIKETAKAHICNSCGEIVFDKNESLRLLDLSKNY